MPRGTAICRLMTARPSSWPLKSQTIIVLGNGDGNGNDDSDDDSDDDDDDPSPLLPLLVASLLSAVTSICRLLSMAMADTGW